MHSILYICLSLNLYIMRKYHILFLLLCTGYLFLLSCHNEEERTGEQQFREQLDSFSESIENIDETMNLVDLLNKELERLEEKVRSGALSREQANKLAEELNETYRREIAKRSNLNPAKSLPQWAKDIGLTEPRGLVLDRDFSKKTSVHNQDEGYNSIKLVYRGNYDAAIEQAKRIAENAKLPLSKNYADAFAKAEKYPSALKEIRGISYMNYKPGDQNLDYKISVSVDADGVLTIYAVDESQRRAYYK